MNPTVFATARGHEIERQNYMSSLRGLPERQKKAASRSKESSIESDDSRKSDYNQRSQYSRESGDRYQQNRNYQRNGSYNHKYNHSKLTRRVRLCQMKKYLIISKEK